MDATGQRWVAALSDYDFSIKYRSGKKNADANGLSRIPEGNGKQNIIFPEVLKALCLSTTVSQENCPLVESLAFTQTDKDAESVPESLLHAHALSSMDWRKAQRQNPTLKVIIDNLEVGSRVSAQQIQIDRRYLKEWENYYLSQDVLYRRGELNGQQFQQICPPLGTQR